MNLPLLISRAFRRRFLTKNNHFIRTLSSKISTNVSMASKRLIWVDLEMTGLDIKTCHIIEMACLITDENLNIVAEVSCLLLSLKPKESLDCKPSKSPQLLKGMSAYGNEGPDIVIHQPDRALEAMDDWCTKHHGESGLTAAVRASEISLSQAEQIFLEFVSRHTTPKQCPLAGNSVHVDKKFLDKYMPKFMDHLHYRIVDVSTIKELCRRWYPKTYKQVPGKKEHHRALEDIKESIAELRFYKQTIFK